MSWPRVQSPAGTAAGKSRAAPTGGGLQCRTSVCRGSGAEGVKASDSLPPSRRLLHKSGRPAMGGRDHLFKVLVVGDAAVGKTSLVQRYSQDSFSKHYKSTVGGQERFTSMTRLYYRDASACVIMFDVTNATTFSNSQRWKQDLDSKLTLPNGEPVPCLLLANKCDLSPWAVSRDQVDRFSKENGFTGWTETSVKENKNINEAMRVLIEKMMSNSREDMSLSTQGDYINLQTKPSSSWACC
ncbi:ras-related protein Rab-7L1 isoform X2 [Halichoerus grypus]|uniref:ras-related protein Rab-7L1 isoform X2 n=1 Tax=Halichoerus grypus TaxID=9711 RepID=UPI001659DA12|nr:ras-related protein Rab-7L1 isoform X2 [Halichoerus grypus]